MRKLLSILSLSLLYITIAFGQAAVDIPFTVEDSNGNIQTLSFGLDLTGTSGIDNALGEFEQPPFPPGGAFAARFVSLTGQSQLGEGTLKDIRNAPIFPFSGTYSHRIKFAPGDPNYLLQTITVHWNLPPTIVAGSTISNTGFGGPNTQPFTGVGSMTILVPGDFDRLNIVIVYFNAGPSGPAPIFGISPPAPLEFGLVSVGSSSPPVPVTVSNTGTANLVISGVTSSNAQFTFTSSPFPITVLPGLNTIFNVTFTPTSSGLKTGILTFSHNGPGPTTSYAVQGTGVQIIEPSITIVNLVNVGTGSTTSTDIIVTNNGTTSLTVLANLTELANWSITPLSWDIPGGLSRPFTLTFIAPAIPGLYTATLEFTSGNYSSGLIPLSASVVSIAGLIFAKDTVYNYEDDSYSEEMQLVANNGWLHALQFRLLTNQAVDDHTILTFLSIQKGADIANPNWILETNVARGPITPNGASKDTIYVLLYNINQAGDLGEPNYNHMFTVNYRVARLQPLQNNIKSSFKIFNAEGSTFTGSPLNITPSRNELVVIAKAAGGGYGDVNGDGCVDILDLIMVVDHIVGRDSLTGAEFTRANIAPWILGDPAPTPDLVVNVQDLSLIQNIILTGYYPNGNPVAPCGYLAKSDGTADATVTLYINSEGITAYVDAEIGIRGAQIEFGSVSNNPENMVISTPLGQGYYLLAQGLLRTLMYDRGGQKNIDAGINNFMADMPFNLTNPNDVSVVKIVLVDINTKKLGNIVIQTVYGETPTLPLDYILFQNYPNPFNPTTAVKFQVPKTSDVTVKIYNMLGQEIRTLFAGEVMRGTYTVNWDGLNDAGIQMSSGSYVYRMIAGEFIQSKKMILLK